MLEREKELTQIATNNEIVPNLLRRWKSEFLEKAAMIFDAKRDEKLKEALSEKDTYQR